MPSGPSDVRADHLNLLVADNLVARGSIDVARVGSLLEPYTSMAEYQAHYLEHLDRTAGNAGRIYGRDLLYEMERFAQQVVRIVKMLNIDFDVIHAHDWTTFPAAMALKRATGKPLLVHVHITEFDKTGGEHADPRVYAMEQAGMRAADLVIAVSDMVPREGLRQRMAHDPHTPCEVGRELPP